MPDTTSGKTGQTILAKDSLFNNGFLAGRARFFGRDYYKGKAFLDVEVYDFIIYNINDVGYQNTFNAGYILGWMSGFFTGDNPTIQTADKLLEVIIREDK